MFGIATAIIVEFSGMSIPPSPTVMRTAHSNDASSCRAVVMRPAWGLAQQTHNAGRPIALDGLPVADRRGRTSAPDDGRDLVLASDDRTVTHDPARVGDDGRREREQRCPRRRRRLCDKD